MKTRKAIAVVKAMQQAAAPVPPAPAPAAAAAAKKAKVNARLNRVISVLVANPKKPSSKSFARFNLYRNGMTVGEYVKAGGRVGDCGYDQKKGLLP